MCGKFKKIVVSNTEYVCGRAKVDEGGWGNEDF